MSFSLKVRHLLSTKSLSMKKHPPDGKYSRTSHKRSPKMQRLSGCLREVVADKNRTTGGPLLRRRPETPILRKTINLLHATSKLRHVQFHVVTKVLRIFLVAQCTQQTQRSENLSSGRLQEVKNNGQLLTGRRKKWSRSLTGGGRLLEVPINCRALTGKILVFWIGGHLWELVTHGGLTVLLTVVSQLKNILHQRHQ